MGPPSIGPPRKFLESGSVKLLVCGNVERVLKDKHDTSQSGRERILGPSREHAVGRFSRARENVMSVRCACQIRGKAAS